MLRLDPPANVCWYDVDYPEVIKLCRRVYDEHAPRQSHRMIASSVVEPGRLDEVAADRPIVMEAEGLVPYLKKDDLVTLLARITDRFPAGGIGFDAWNSLAARLAPLQRQLRAIGARTAGWGINDPRELAHLVSRLEFYSEINFAEIPELDRLPRAYRVVIGLLSSIPLVREMGRILRYRF